jgi:hypothetical protein
MFSIQRRIWIILTSQCRDRLERQTDGLSRSVSSILSSPQVVDRDQDRRSGCYTELSWCSTSLYPTQLLSSKLFKIKEISSWLKSLCLQSRCLLLESHLQSIFAGYFWDWVSQTICWPPIFQISASQKVARITDVSHWQFFFSLFLFLSIIVVLVLHCDIYKSSYITAEFIPSVILLYPPPHIPRTVSTGLIFPFSYTSS